MLMAMVLDVLVIQIDVTLENKPRSRLERRGWR